MDAVNHESILFSRLIDQVHKVIVGQDEILEGIILAILCDGHVLLEGVPGVAKTTMIKSVSKAIGLSFKRIQFTPDLLPSDLIGTLMYNAKTQEFETKKGPVFANLVLADEINRAPAKVQAALLEAMQEHQVTLGSQTYPLDEPFMVLATQNPVEQEGTYSLPEAQVDRFLCKLLVTYPTFEEEKILLRRKPDLSIIEKIVSIEDIFSARKVINQMYVDDKIVDYIARIVHATRRPEEYGLLSVKKSIDCGASPRATLALFQAAKGYAFLKRRNFVIPDDVKSVAHMVLRHRIVLSYEAQAAEKKPDDIIKEILITLQAP